MEDIIKRTQKQHYRTGEPIKKREKEWEINKDFIKRASLHPTTVRNPNTINLNEEDRRRIDDFFRKRKQSETLDGSTNDMPVNLALYLSYISTKPTITFESSTLNSVTIVEEYDLSTSQPIRITLQPEYPDVFKVKIKTVNRILSELKSQFAIEGNKIKLTDLETFLNHRIIPLIESNKMDDTFVF